MQPHADPVTSILPSHCGTLPAVLFTVKTCLQLRRGRYQGLELYEEVFAKGNATNLPGGCDLVPNAAGPSTFWTAECVPRTPVPAHNLIYPVHFFLSFQHSWAHRIQDDQKTHSINTKAVGDHKHCIGLNWAAWGRAGSIRHNCAAHTKTTSHNCIRTSHPPALFICGC